ncbi:MAG: hypothetical protein ACO2O2_12850 [Acidilobaceae archaeon]
MPVNGVRVSNLVYYAILGVAVVNVSTASILVRLAGGEGVHGFAVAAWRLALSSILTWILLLLLGGSSLARLLSRPRDLALMSMSGIALAFPR